MSNWPFLLVHKNIFVFHPHMHRLEGFGATCLSCIAAVINALSDASVSTPHALCQLALERVRASRVATQTSRGLAETHQLVV